MKTVGKLLAFASLGIATAFAPSAAQASETGVTADCVIAPHADWIPPEVHVRCNTGPGPFKALALCSGQGHSNVTFASPWTNVGSRAAVACPYTWKLTGWGKQGGGSA